jgi:uncharacterized protein YebE (UPF0316 family)
MVEFFETDAFRWVLLPLMIFAARILDVSIQTIRIVFVSRGHKIVASTLGFFEVLIWLMAISQIIRNLSNPLCYIAYGGGFAAGTFIGLVIEEKLAIGAYLVRIITKLEATDLVGSLRAAGFGVTNVPAEGASGKVCVVYTVVRRASMPEVMGIVKQHNPGAFYTIENIRSVSEGSLPPGPPGPLGVFSRRSRKGK